MTDGTAHRTSLHRLSGERPSTFGEYLTRLKRAGSALLVTGETPTWVQQHASRKLLGKPRYDGDATPRQRLLVVLDGSVDPAPYFPSGATDAGPAPRVIQGESAPRGAAATAAPDGAPTLPDAASFRGLAERVVETVSEIASDAGGVEPGALRLATTSLLPILEADGAPAASSFCETIGRAVRDDGGMAHFHCPLPDSSDVVRQLNRAVDARVELRQRDGNPVECRWNTPYPELTLNADWTDFG